jgi:hypothetical protein
MVGEIPGPIRTEEFMEPYVFPILDAIEQTCASVLSVPIEDKRVYGNPWEQFCDAFESEMSVDELLALVIKLQGTKED